MSRSIVKASSTACSWLKTQIFKRTKRLQYSLLLRRTISMPLGIVRTIYYLREPLVSFNSSSHLLSRIPSTTSPRIVFSTVRGNSSNMPPTSANQVSMTNIKYQVNWSSSNHTWVSLLPRHRRWTRVASDQLRGNPPVLVYPDGSRKHQAMPIETTLKSMIERRYSVETTSVVISNNSRLMADMPCHQWDPLSSPSQPS
mgnify:CR=1 FL=1